jgi:poly(beta-D-mannuronate) lyase
LGCALTLAIGLVGLGMAPATAATAAPYPHVTKVKPKDETVEPGETIKASVKAENTASRASRTISLAFILSRSTSPDGGKVLRTGTLPSIDADDDRKTEFEVTIPGTTTDGNYRLLVAHPRKGLSPRVLGTVAVKVKSDDGSGDGEDDGDEGPSDPGSSDGTPARVLDLTNWKLTLPIGSSAHSATEVKQPTLDTYANSTYFHVDATGKGVVFRANAGGATTSGSTYPRSELREMTDGGKKEAGWSSKSGTHVMTVTEAITAVPAVKPHVVAAQIHDSEDDVVMVRLEKNRLFVEADGDEVGVLDPAYVLGTRFTVELRATSTGIRVTYNGAKTVTYVTSGSGYYFKAGCYTQSNVDRGDKASAYGEVVIYGLAVKHT